MFRNVVTRVVLFFNLKKLFFNFTFIRYWDFIQPYQELEISVNNYKTCG